MDGVMTKAPLGRGASGPNPTDRANRGVKRSLLTDGNGIPLAVVVATGPTATTTNSWRPPSTGSWSLARPLRRRRVRSICVWTPATTPKPCERRWSCEATRRPTSVRPRDKKKRREEDEKHHPGARRPAVG